MPFSGRDPDRAMDIWKPVPIALIQSWQSGMKTVDDHHDELT